MNTEPYNQIAQDYERIEQSIRFSEANIRTQPDLTEIANHLGLSELQFQQLFTRWVGVSPKHFFDFLNKAYVKKVLQQTHSILDAIHTSGLSSSERLNDLLVTYEVVTPGAYKPQREAMLVQYGFHPSPFGEFLLAVTPRGICNLMFLQEGARSMAVENLKSHWKWAQIEHDQAATKKLAESVFQNVKHEPLPVFLRGTNFQIKVWEALLHIPTGSIVTYKDIAVSIGLPRAARAVGNAVAHNLLAVIVPCHRAVRNGGDFGKYLYGSARKMALFAWERAQKERLD